MAKIYDKNQRNEPGKEPVQAQKRSMGILVAIILGLVFVLILYRMARGEEVYLSETFANLPVISSFYASDRQ